MDVVVPEKSQGEKVFRARKTMKTSDRHQLESIHNARSSPALPSSSSAPSSSSSPPSPAVVNGKSPDREEQTETEKVRESPADRNPRETRPSSPSSHSPSPLTLSLSLSPSPPSQTPELTSCSNAPSSPALSPSSVGKGREGDQGPSFMEGGETMADEKTDGGEGKEVEEGAVLRVKDKEDEGPKPGNDVSSPLDSPQESTSASPLASETKEGDRETETDKGTESEEAVAMDTDPASTETASVPAADTTSCPSLSPSHVPESDQEVKEGFLVLSEEDEAQGERGGGKEREKINRDGEQTQMEVCAERKEVGEDVGISAPSPSPALPPYGDTGGVEQCNSIPSARKRARSKDPETDARRERGEEAVAVRPLGKRQKVEGELEAQLELKIRADGGTRIKLEEVVQQLVEERLRVLQLSVFDKSLQELRERVEKMDCATKHQQTINTLQAKIARLAKKFGAANQAKENVSSPQEVRSLQSAASTSPTSTTSTTSTFRPVETKVANQSNQTPPPRPLSATASPAQPKPLSTPTPPPPSPTGSAPTPSPVSTTATSDTTPGWTAGASRTPPLQAGPTPLPPLLTQLPLPLPLADAQGGTIGTKPRAGLEPIPVSTDSALDDAKTTTTGTSFKTTPSPSAPTLSQITPARGAHPGGSSVVGVPGAGGLASSARPPTQCVPVVGVASSSTPGSGAGQPALPGPPSVTGPDNQTISFAASKPPAQAPRTSRSGAFIDLTEDDDDGAQGVKKAPVQSGSNAASSSFSCSSSLSSPAPSATQRPAGPPPSPLISSSPPHGPAAGSTARSSPQSGLHTGHGPALPHRSPQNSPSKIRPATSVAGSSPAPASSRPSPPPPALLPPPGGRTPPPQRPELKLARVHSDSGIVLSWCLTEEANLACAPLDSYHLYAYHQDRAGPPRLPPLPPLPPSSSSSSRWKKIGEVKALPLPMACTLTQFVAGSTYYFAVCAQDVRGRFGPFCEPQCTEVIGSLSSS